MATLYRLVTYLASILFTSIISTALICTIITPPSFSSIFSGSSLPSLPQTQSPPTTPPPQSPPSSLSSNWISTDQALYCSYSRKAENYLFSFKSRNQDAKYLSEIRNGGGNECQYRQEYAKDYNHNDDFNYGNDKSARDLYSRETSILIKSQIRNILHHQYQDNNNNNRHGHGRSCGKALRVNQKYSYISGPQDASGRHRHSQKGYVVLRPYSENLIYSMQHPHSHSTGFLMESRKLNVAGSGRRRSISRAWNPSSAGASNVNRWYSDLRQHQHHYCYCDRHQGQANKHHRSLLPDDTTATSEKINSSHVDFGPCSRSHSGKHNGKFQQQRKNSSTFLLTSFFTSFPATLSELLNAHYCVMLSLLNHLVFLFCNTNGGYTPNPYDLLSSSGNTHTPQRLAPHPLIAMLASNLLIRLSLLIVLCVGAFYYCVTVMDQQQQQIAGGAMLGRGSTGSNWWGENGVGSRSRTASTTASVSGSESRSAAIDNSNFGDSSTSSSASTSSDQQQLMDVSTETATTTATDTPTSWETSMANTIRNRESGARASVFEDQRSTSTLSVAKPSLAAGLISALIRSSVTAVALTCSTEVPCSASNTPSSPQSLPIKLQKNILNKKLGFEDKIIGDKEIPISKTAQEKGPRHMEDEEASLFDYQSFRDLQYRVPSYHECISRCVACILAGYPSGQISITSTHFDLSSKGLIAARYLSDQSWVEAGALHGDVYSSTQLNLCEHGPLAQLRHPYQIDF
ncbi:hypothetical protein EDD21DRAFT_352708 [Dissophora ornata]|nr:hypothetical protein EDD21DRAFT_352708 [Dissophora ornata]